MSNPATIGENDPNHERTLAAKERTEEENGTPNPTRNLETTATATAGRAANNQRTFHVFISHAGEDKEAIAVPLFHEMRKRRLHPFLDKERIWLGHHGPTIMRFAMETAPIGVFVLSPEALAKKWPFLELQCFLSRCDAAKHNPRECSPPPLIIPVFHRLTWEDCGLGQDAFFEKFQEVFENPDFGFAGREEKGEVSKMQVMHVLDRIRGFSGVERRAGGDYALIMETAKAVQKEMRHHVQQNEGWDYLDEESKGASTGSSYARGIMQQIQGGRDMGEIDGQTSASEDASGFSSYVIQEGADGTSETNEAGMSESHASFSWASVSAENVNGAVKSLPSEANPMGEVAVEKDEVSKQQHIYRKPPWILSQEDPLSSQRKRQRRKAAGLLVNGLFGSTSQPDKPEPKKMSAAQPRPEIQVPPRGIGPVYEPNENDVLCGRGGRINAHTGNVRFRDIVANRKKDYLDPKTKKLEKAHIAAEIVRNIRAKNPPGRFLKEDHDGSWFDIGDAKAIKKVGQALREDAPDIREETVSDEGGNVQHAAADAHPPQQETLLAYRSIVAPPPPRQPFLLPQHEPFEPKAIFPNARGYGAKPLSGAAAAAIAHDNRSDTPPPTKELVVGRSIHVPNPSGGSSTVAVLGGTGATSVLSGLSNISALTNPISALSGESGGAPHPSTQQAVPVTTQQFQAMRHHQLQQLRQQWAQAPNNSRTDLRSIGESQSVDGMSSQRSRSPEGGQMQHDNASWADCSLLDSVMSSEQSFHSRDQPLEDDTPVQPLALAEIGGGAEPGAASSPTGKKPGEFDVCCGQRKRRRDHIGNIRYRQAIQSNAQRYMDAPSAHDRKAVIASIVNDILHMGGSFLKRDSNGNWYDIGDQHAMYEVGLSLNNVLSATRRQAPKPQVPQQHLTSGLRKGGTVSKAVAAAAANDVPGNPAPPQDIALEPIIPDPDGPFGISGLTNPGSGLSEVAGGFSGSSASTNPSGLLLSDHAKALQQPSDNVQAGGKVGLRSLPDADSSRSLDVLDLVVGGGVGLRSLPDADSSRSLDVLDLAVPDMRHLDQGSLSVVSGHLSRSLDVLDLTKTKVSD